MAKKRTKKIYEYSKETRSRVKHALETGVKPPGWNKEAEDLLELEILFQKRDREWRKKAREEAEKREQLYTNSDTARLLEDLNGLAKQFESRATLASGMRLTGNNATHTFNQALIDYLESLQDASLKLEACHNVIKIAKNYIREE